MAGRWTFGPGSRSGSTPAGTPWSPPCSSATSSWPGSWGRGKSTLLTDLLAGAALDPVVDIDVFCFAENNDYEWLEPVASTISMQDTAENVAACMAHIQALHASLTERGELLKHYGINSVT